MTPSPRPRRTLMRLVVAGSLSALALGATAFPANAQVYSEPSIAIEVDQQVMHRDEPDWGTIDIELGMEYDSHPSVTAEWIIDAPEGTFEFTDESYDGTCEAITGGSGLSCENPENSDGYSASFQFGYGPTADAALGVYEYVVTATVDGVPIEPITGQIEITDFAGLNPHKPFSHGNTSFDGAAPGSEVEIAPVFLQERAIADDAEAIVVSFGDPFSRVGMDLEGAEAIADYDNCFEGRWSSDRGVTCVVTEFEDRQGELFTLSADTPVTYAIDETAAGPMDVCHCYYSVYTVDAQLLEEELGGVFWDESSNNLLGLETAESWDGPTSEYDAPYQGTITITTTENPFDLAVADVNVDGAEGDEVTVTVPVSNNGPAAAFALVDFYGSYAVRAQLPAGLELVEIDSGQEEAWACLDSESLETEYGYIEDQTELEWLDLSCYFERLEPGESIDFSFTVKITDPATATDGLIEVNPVYTSQYSESLDGDLENNLALIGVNAADLIGSGDEDGDGSGKLPITGVSMTVVITGAAAALVAGAVIFVLMRRRRTSTDW